MAECHFFRLPVELRFAIYGFAYGTGRTIVPRKLKTIPRNTTAVKQAIEHKEKPKNVNEVRLVSKRFHAEAMQCLTENNTFRLARHLGSLVLVSPQFAQDIGSLFLDWNNHHARDRLDLNRLCPRLQSLEIFVELDLLDDSKFSRSPALPTDEDLRSSSMVDALSMVRGLKHFKLHESSAGHPPYCNILFAGWALGNAARVLEGLEKVLLAMVMREKEAAG